MSRRPGWAICASTLPLMLARVPASAANLGPGFDTLALALALYVEVEIDTAPALTIVAEGEGADLPCDGSHLAARVAKQVIGHDRLSIRVRSDIPVARGLGSSAAIAVAAAAAAGAEDPTAVATAFEDGHPENVAAAVHGGLVTATTVENRPLATSLFLDPDLAFVVLVPDTPLSTKKARQALPEHVPLADAAFNLGRLGWLIASLGDASGLQPEVMADRLHQNPRSGLFPQAAGLLDALVDAGAAAACWSGAGPTLLGLCVGKDRAERVRTKGERALAKAGVDGEAWVLEADMAGLHVE